MSKKSSQPTPSIGNFMTRLPLTIDHDASLNEAHKTMRLHQVRHLPVVHESVVIGVVSVGDLHLIESLGGVDRDEVKVKEAMSSPVYHVKETDPVHLVAAKMARDHLGSAVVLDDDDHVVGIFTVTDALTALLHAYKS